jgi:hypothetical protein
MSRRFLRPVGLVTLVAAAGLTLWLFAAGASGERGHKTSAHAAQAGQVTCPQSPQPKQPLELNSEEVEGVVKTVVMEKELFTCQQQVGDFTHQIARDVETFIEIVSRGTSTGIDTVSRKALVTTCDTDYFSRVITCGKQTFTVGFAPQPIPPSGCSTNTIPDDPVEMSTVAVHDNSAPNTTAPWMRTFKVDKLIAGCNDNTVLADIYTFTEVIEPRTGAAGTGSYTSPGTTRFDGVVCLKNKNQGVITGCSRWKSGQ